MVRVVLGPAEFAQLEELRRHAEAPPWRYGLARMLRRVSGSEPPPGDVPEHVRQFASIRIVYSVEEHPGGWFRFASVSLPPRAGGIQPLPSPFVCFPLIDRLGFRVDRAGVAELQVDTKTDRGAVRFVQPFREGS